MDGRVGGGHTGRHVAYGGRLQHSQLAQPVVGPTWHDVLVALTLTRVGAAPPPRAAPLATVATGVRPAHSLALLPDRDLCVCAAENGGKLLVVSLQTQRVDRELAGHRGPVNTLALAAGGRLLLSGSDGQQQRRPPCAAPPLRPHASRAGAPQPLPEKPLRRRLPPSAPAAPGQPAPPPAPHGGHGPTCSPAPAPTGACHRPTKSWPPTTASAASPASLITSASPATPCKAGPDNCAATDTPSAKPANTIRPATRQAPDEPAVRRMTSSQRPKRSTASDRRWSTR